MTTFGIVVFLKMLGIAALLAVLLYFAGSFIAAGWDIREWDRQGRAMLVMVWAAASAASIGLLADRGDL